MLKKTLIASEISRITAVALAGAASLTGLGIANAAVAQSTLLEEVVVTAQKREESAQDIPIAITAFNGDAMKDLGFSSSLDLAAQTPGMQAAANFGEGNIPVINIRGVAMLDFAEHNESPSAVYVDEMYKANLSGLDFSLFDIERAEVLRGPQGTLFGRNATGGLVQYHTVKPSQEGEGYVEMTLGERGRVKAEGAVGGGLTDTVSGRLSVIYNKHDGYYDQQFPGHEDGNQIDMWGVRGQLLIEPSDELSVLLSLQTAENDNDGGNPYVVTPTATDDRGRHIRTGRTVADRKVNTNIQSTLKTEADTALVRIEYDLSDHLSLVSLSGYEKIEKAFVQDTDASALDLLDTAYDPEGEELSQEIRLQGNSDNSRWVAGVYYLKYENDGRQQLFAGEDFLGPGLHLAASTVSYDMETESWAIFGQYEYDFNDRLTGVVGLRYGEEEKTFEANFVDHLGLGSGDLAFTKENFGDLTEQNPKNTSYNLRLNYTPNEDWLIYAGTSNAFKAGTYNMGFFPTADVNDMTVDEEELTSYEVGFKGSILAGAGRLNGAVFYYDYKDHQAFAFDGVSLATQVFNNDATIAGAELELMVNPADGLDVMLGIGYLDAKLEDIADPRAGGVAADPVTNPSIVKDRQMVMAPRLSANALVRYAFDAPWGGVLAVQGDAVYTGEHYFDALNSPGLRQGGNTIHNVRTTWSSEDDKWKVALAVENVTDKEKTNFMFEISDLLGITQTIVNKPRWVSATVSYRW